MKYVYAVAKTIIGRDHGVQPQINFLQCRLYKKSTHPFREIQQYSFEIYGLFSVAFINTHSTFSHCEMTHFECQVQCYVVKLFGMDAVIYSLIHVTLV